jgi:hypothetical protein
MPIIGSPERAPGLYTTTEGRPGAGTIPAGMARNTHHLGATWHAMPGLPAATSAGIPPDQGGGAVRGHARVEGASTRNTIEDGKLQWHVERSGPGGWLRGASRSVGRWESHDAKPDIENNLFFQPSDGF